MRVLIARWPPFPAITWKVTFDEYRDKDSDNGDGGVWEWIDVTVPEYRVSFLLNLANSKNAKMRLSGQYTKTRNLTWNERQGIKDVINGYRALKEGLK